MQVIVMSPYFFIVNSNYGFLARRLAAAADGKAYQVCSSSLQQWTTMAAVADEAPIGRGYGFARRPRWPKIVMVSGQQLTTSNSRVN